MQKVISMDSTDVVESCSICDEELNEENPTCIVQKRGLKTLIRVSKERADDRWKRWESSCQVRLHFRCRNKYAFPSNPTKPWDPSTAKNHLFDTREIVLQNNFQFDKLCLFCGKDYKSNQKKGRIIKRDELKHRILHVASQRSDDLSKTIKSRLLHVESVAELEARYHVDCYFKFFYRSPENPRKQGVIPHLESTLSVIFKFIEDSQECEFVMSDFTRLMSGYKMSTKTLYRRLQEKFGNDIKIISNVGKEDKCYIR